MTSTAMKTNSRFNKVLSGQSFGFLAIIALCWLNSLFGLPSLIMDGRVGVSDFQGPMLQMLLVLTVWLLVSFSTRRTLERLKHLESFMRVCAWCHKINHQGQWKTPERYLAEGFDTSATHGICVECLAHQTELVEQRKRLQKTKPAALPSFGVTQENLPAC